MGKSNAFVAIHPRLVVNSAEPAIDAAIAGLGITRVLSYQAVSAIRAGTLTVVLQTFEPAPWPVSLVYSGGRGLLPLKLRAFIDFAHRDSRLGVPSRAWIVLDLRYRDQLRLALASGRFLMENSHSNGARTNP
jgi:hypothetical protein